MIKKLDNKKHDVAKSIRQVFQVSYAVEAQLLKAKEFPPLKRPLEDFITSESIFYGYFEGQVLAAVVEVKKDQRIVHIQSLVVDPTYFRRGIASQMLQFLIDEFSCPKWTVETGAANAPAIALYERHGFRIVKQWMTEIGIEKVAFERG